MVSLNRTIICNQLTTMDINEIRQRIEELAKEQKILEGNLQEAVVNAIQEIAQENPHQIKKSPAGFRMMTISASELFDKPWSFEFFNWEESASAILKYLANTPVTSWKKKLTDLLEESKGTVVELKKRGTIWPGITGIIKRTSIDRVFIEKVIEKI